MYHLINGRRVVEHFHNDDNDNDDDNEVGGDFSSNFSSDSSNVKSSRKGFSTADWIGIGIASAILVILIVLLIWASVTKKTAKYHGKGSWMGRKFKYKFY